MRNWFISSFFKFNFNGCWAYIRLQLNPWIWRVQTSSPLFRHWKDEIPLILSGPRNRIIAGWLFNCFFSRSPGNLGSEVHLMIFVMADDVTDQMLQVICNLCQSDPRKPSSNWFDAIGNWLMVGLFLIAFPFLMKINEWQFLVLKITM